MNSSQGSKVTLAQDPRVTRRTCQQIFMIFCAQGNAIHLVRPHYLWRQDHSAKGDETRNAPIHTQRPQGQGALPP